MELQLIHISKRGSKSSSNQRRFIVDWNNFQWNLNQDALICTHKNNNLKMSSVQLTISRSGNGLLPNRLQIIVWVYYVDYFPWYIYASPSPIESAHFPQNTARSKTSTRLYVQAVGHSRKCNNFFVIAVLILVCFIEGFSELMDFTQIPPAVCEKYFHGWNIVGQN